MKEVIPDVYHLRIPSPHPFLTHVNCYAVRKNNTCMLVDTGWNTEDSFLSVKEQLATIGIGLKDISHIIITHIHPDHYGAAGRIREISGARLIMHPKEKEFIHSRYIDMDGLLLEMEQVMFRHGTPSAEAHNLATLSVGMVKYVSPAMPDITFQDGEALAFGNFNFKMIWTPGHSPGHMVVYEPERKILFSGDCILHDITPNVSFNPQSGVNPLGDFLNSLERLKLINVNLVLPGHNAFITDLKRRAGEIVAHHHWRGGECLAALKSGSKTAYKVASGLTWTDQKFDTMDPLDKRLAILEAMAHLEWLRYYGKVRLVSRDNINYYDLAA